METTSDNPQTRKTVTLKATFHIDVDDVHFAEKLLGAWLKDDYRLLSYDVFDSWTNRPWAATT